MPSVSKMTKKELVSEIESLRKKISELEARSGREKAGGAAGTVTTSVNHQGKIYEFADLFDLTEIQKIQDAFSSATGVASIITYPDGRPITLPSNFCRLCKDIIRNTEKGRCNCYASDAIIGRQNTGGPIVQTCLSGGLWDAGASISVGDKHIANWLIGQVRNDAIDEEKIIAYAEEIGADEDDFRKALSEVTVMPIEQFEHISNALFLIANQMSRMAFQNARLQEAIAVRERTEASLRENEQKLQRIFDSIPDAIVVVDRLGTVVDVNPSATELTGYSEDDLLAMTFSDIVAKESLQDAKNHFTEVMNAGKSEGELAIYRNDGLRRDVFMRGVKIFDDYLLGYSRDITDQKRVNKILMESEERFRGLFDNMSSGVVVYEAVDGGRDFIIKDVNRAAERIEKVKKQDILGHRVSEVFPGVEAFGILDVFREVWKTGKPQHYPVSLYTDNNLTGWRDNYVLSLRSGEVVAVYDDVTERKIAEQKLRDSEERFRRLAENAKDMIYRMSLPDGNYEYVSPATFDIFGYSPEEWYRSDKLIREVIHPEWRVYLKTHWENLLRGKVLPSYEYQIIHKSGSIKWINQRNVLVTDPEGHPIAIEGIVTDVTDQKLAETRLLASEERFRLLMEQSPFAIEVYRRDGVMAQANKAWERLWNVPDRTRFVGTYNILSDIQAKEIGYSDAISRAFVGGSTDIAEAVYNPRLSGNPGRRRYLHSSIYPLFDDNKEIINAVMIHEDITTRKEVAQERELLISELEAKNTELERFTYTVSHDLKSPLITIRGFLGMLKKDFAAADQKRVDDDLARIGNAADKMHALLDDVLRLSRIGRIVNLSENISLRQLTEEVVELLHGPLQEKNIAIHISDDLPKVYGDRVRLYEVMQNLIENAVKFIGDAEQPTIEIGVRTEAHQHICFVKDNGIGIDPKFHDKVFDLFDQLSQNVDGTGVGLAMVKRIIETHGGRVWVESRGVGTGSTFCFTIPPRAKND